MSLIRSNAVPAWFVLASAPTLVPLGTFIAGILQQSHQFDNLIIPFYISAGIKKQDIPMAALAALLIWTYVITSAMSLVSQAFGSQTGSYDNKDPRHTQSILSDVYKRIFNSHRNLLEQFPAIAVSLIIAHIQKVPIEYRISFSIIYSTLRIAYVFFYIADLDALRSTMFLVGQGCVVWLLWLSYFPDTAMAYLGVDVDERFCATEMD